MGLVMSASLPLQPALLAGQHSEKGLFNAQGLYNCFVSVVIQSLWHLEAFRTGFVALPQHSHPTSDEQAACVRCALTQIFTHFEFADESVLPPDALRVALSLVIDTRLQTSKFALGAMSDAEEALEEVLRFLHCDHVGAETKATNENDNTPMEDATAPHVLESRLSRSLDVACTPECVAHRVFGMQLMEQKMCTQPNCGASSDPEMSTLFLYRIYMDELREHRARDAAISFEAMLKASYSQQDYSCPRPTHHEHGACTGPAKAERWLLNQPAVFTLMCAWSNPEPERDEIEACFSLLPKRIHPERFLQMATTPVEYRLRGMVAYYGKHYVCIFYSPQTRAFVMLDDRRVVRLGAWADVIARCCKGKLQPTIVFFEAVVAPTQTCPRVS
jgi:hypothetical protein